MLNNPFIIFFLGLFLLIYGADAIIDNSKKIALKLNISKIIIGITMVALGTSLPELVVSIFATLKNENGIIVGNIIGSNIANIGLVLGVTAFLSPILIDLNLNRLRFNMTFLLLSTLALIIGLLLNIINIFYGLLLIFLFLVYIYFLFKYFSKDDNKIKENNFNINNYGLLYLFFFVFIGFFIVSLGSDFFIKGAIGISEYFGYKNNLVISMTLVALGTSLPELATSIMAIKQGESNIALGNIIGSNIINILLVVGLCGIISSDFSYEAINILPHLAILLFITLALISIVLLYKKINRMACLFFITLYIIFIYINFI